MQQNLRYQDIWQTFRVEFTLKKLQKNIEVQRAETNYSCSQNLHTNKGSQGNKYFKFANQSGQVTQYTKAFAKDV